jgi:hypothetical protein
MQKTRKPVHRNPVLFVAALYALWGFGYETVWDRFTTSVDGTVILANDKPTTGAPRYATFYTLKDSNGKLTEYIAGATDASLPRSMPIGTSLHKARWELGYERNGTWVNAYSFTFYFVLLSIAVGYLLYAALMWILELKQRKF